MVCRVYGKNAIVVFLKAAYSVLQAGFTGYGPLAGKGLSVTDVWTESAFRGLSKARFDIRQIRHGRNMPRLRAIAEITFG